MRTNAADVGVQFDGLYARKKNNDIARKPLTLNLYCIWRWVQGKLFATIRTKRVEVYIEHTRNDTITV